MATGRSTYLTKQAGEYLVAAELSRRGFITTTFTGNVPHYDIVAVDDFGGHALVQVKTIASGSWQLDLRRFVEIVLDNNRQLIRGRLPEPYPGLICVLVELASPNRPAPDRFFILPWKELQEIVASRHSEYLAKHEGIRPKKPDSYHTAVHHQVLAQWENRWDVLTRRVQPLPANNSVQPTIGRRRRTSAGR